MELQEIINKVEENKKGAFIHLEYKSLPKTKTNDTVEKITVGGYRLGITYANMERNANKETGSLPWGHWLANYENYIIEHCDKHYLRIYEGTIKAVTKWLLNGKETTKEELIANGIIAEPKAKQFNGCFNVPIQNIIAIQ